MTKFVRCQFCNTDIEIVNGYYDHTCKVRIENQIIEKETSVFSTLLREMQELHDKKSHDYASVDDPYANYHFAGKGALLFAHSPEDAGFAGRLFEKLYRLANLEKTGKTPLNEDTTEAEKDIAVIVTLWMASRISRRRGLT